jgi:hypothetical protein
VTTTLEARARRTAARSVVGGREAVALMAWITFVLMIDADGTLWTQRLLGVLTWFVLVLVLARESPLVRAQTAVVVAFASAVEYTFSPLLEVYIYRFHNVPLYVPPGHGLVYLAALGIGRSSIVRRHLRGCTIAVVVVGGAYAIGGLVVGSRVDVLGAFWFVCLLGFLRWGPSRPLYVGAFLVVSYLEILGTSLATWTWQAHDPTGLVPIGNPPSGAAGGYGWFDLAALVVAPWLLERLSRPRSTPQRG